MFELQYVQVRSTIRVLIHLRLGLGLKSPLFLPQQQQQGDNNLEMFLHTGQFAGRVTRNTIFKILRIFRWGLIAIINIPKYDKNILFPYMWQEKYE